MSTIFISHRQKGRDNAIAAQLKERLTELGHENVFLDIDDDTGIPPGEEWQGVLYRKLGRCRAVLVVHSEAWTESQWCFAEATMARALAKTIIPVIIDGHPLAPIVADHHGVKIKKRVSDKSFARIVRGLTAAGIDPELPGDWDSPYPGLMAFDERHADVFFGRDDEIGAGIDMLNRIADGDTGGFALVHGPSGSGKSSLVRAGIVPRLRRFPDRWIVTSPFRVGSDPFRALAEAVSGGTRQRFAEQPERHLAWADVAERLREQAATGDARTGVLAELEAAVRGEEGCGRARVLIVVDQLEELIAAAVEGDPDSRAFLGLVNAEIGRPLGPVVVGTIRSDFLGLLENSDLAALKSDDLLVGPLRSDEAKRDVILRPAARVELPVEERLVEQMVTDTKTSDGLPLLAFVLREMYERHHEDDDGLTLADYERLGGLEGSLGRSADKVLERIRKEHGGQVPAALRHAFVAMVQRSDEGVWVRRIAPWETIDPAAREMLEQFVARRLLVKRAPKVAPDDDPADDGAADDGAADDGAADDGAAAVARRTTVEVAHEALFRSWPALGTWLDDASDLIRFRSDLTSGANAWNLARQETGETDEAEYLWRTTRLALLEEHIGSGALVLEAGSVVEEFYEASLRKEQEEIDRERAEQERKRRRRNRTLAVVSGFAVLAVIAAVFAAFQAQRANQEAKEATALALGMVARDLEPENPALAVAVAAESEASAAVPEARAALLEARANFGAKSFQQVGGALDGHVESVRSVAFAADGGLLVSGGSTGDGRLYFWDPATGEPAGDPVVHDERGVFGVAFRPGSDEFASAGGDGAIRFWNSLGEPTRPALAHVEQGEPADPADPRNCEDEDREIETAVCALAFSPDGTRVVSGDTRGRVWLWDLTTAPPTYAVLERRGPAPAVVHGVAFSPDGTVVAAADDAGTVVVWDVVRRKVVGTLEHPDGGKVFTVAFHPDDPGRLASGTESGVVWLWGAVAGEWRSEALARKHTSWIRGLAFDAQGTSLASASNDGTIRLWAVDEGTATPLDHVLDDHTNWVSSVAFSPDGTRIASGSGDDTVRLWDPRPGTPLDTPIGRHEDCPPDPLDQFADDREDCFATAVAYDSTGAVLVSSGYDRKVRVWDPAAGGELRGPLDATTRLYDVEIGAGDTVLAAGGRGRVFVWDLPDGAADSLTGRVDQRAPLDPGTGEDLPVRAVSFHPTERWLAAGGDDGTVTIWDLADGGVISQIEIIEQREVNVVPESVDALRFAADGTLWIGDFDGNVWSLSAPYGPGQLVELGDGEGHRDAVRGLAVSSDGSRLASVSKDKKLWLWDTGDGRPVLRELEEHTGSVSAVAFVGGKDWLATSSNDGTIRLWALSDASLSGRQAPPGAVLVPRSECTRSCYVNDLAVSPVEDRLATAGPGAVIRVWADPSDRAELCAGIATYVRATELVDQLPVGYDTKTCNWQLPGEGGAG